MLSEKSFEEIKRELLPIKNLGKGVVIYGSVLTEHFIPGRSDIDVAIITMMKENNEQIWKDALGRVNPEKYDVRVFELLPLHIKAQIIKNYRTVSGDEGEIGEYFYYWRKLAEHIEMRREPVTIEDLRAGRERLKKLSLS